MSTVDPRWYYAIIQSCTGDYFHKDTDHSCETETLQRMHHGLSPGELIALGTPYRRIPIAAGNFDVQVPPTQREAPGL
ncbi:hypothetical protein TNCV_2489361 [Trichonephila clavipes]|nr:hypothetical protein TNCV_2489361 [Trichonephila clavipes]